MYHIGHNLTVFWTAHCKLCSPFMYPFSGETREHNCTAVPLREALLAGLCLPLWQMLPRSVHGGKQLEVLRRNHRQAGWGAVRVGDIAGLHYPHKRGTWYSLLGGKGHRAPCTGLPTKLMVRNPPQMVPMLWWGLRTRKTQWCTDNRPRWYHVVLYFCWKVGGIF